MKVISIEEQKAIQLEILEHIDSVLQSNHIDYWLDGGTLLGCIRHGGFIPWDDDIDLIVRREDYDRAIKALIRCDSNGKYKLLNMHTDSSYYYLFSKIVDTRTKLIENGLKEIPSLGVYVDLFPLDYIPDDYQDREKYYKRVFHMRSMVSYSAMTLKDVKGAPFKTKLKYTLSKVIDTHIIMLMIENLCKKTSEKKSNEVVDAIGIWEKGKEVPANVFSDTLMKKFENKLYPVPSGYDKYLTSLYGDYMKFPPAEDRVYKHNPTAFWR